MSSEEALVGVELTATLTDLEGGVSASGQITDESGRGIEGLRVPDFTVPEDAVGIGEATSSTYTPVTDDADQGYVIARVSYTYQFGATKTGTIGCDPSPDQSGEPGAEVQ